MDVAFFQPINCFNDRPRRSNFQTTRVSPSLRYSMAARNSLRRKADSGLLIGEDPYHSSLLQGIDLEGKVLFCFRDTGVAYFL
jgi:hypothetical protein